METDPLLILMLEALPVLVIGSFIAAYVWHIIEEEIELRRYNRERKDK